MTTKIRSTAGWLLGAALALPAAALAQDIPEDISTAVETAEMAGVVGAITSGGEVTVFVPNNEAIAGAPSQVLDQVLADEEMLSSVINGYAVEGTVMAADAAEAITSGGGTFEVESLGGTMLALTMDGDVISVAGVGDIVGTVVTPDVQFGNITVHVIDGAILPAMPEM
jgi:uncharacterized surface protein with fasciclin (FAS1) repeats